ncbi:MAG TPA: Arc family DNA-binding protein [Phycisphaerales bacterium]|nr:Arc family DNA-binding protein [Phycisphaerales bacterium]
MAEERKSILLRIPTELWEEITRMAQRDLRSTNAQIEFLLREALRQRGQGRDSGKPRG